MIELLVVVAIIGILASVVLASLNSARNKGADATIKSQLQSLRASAEIYYDGASNYKDFCLHSNTVWAQAEAVLNKASGGTSTCTEASEGAKYAIYSPLKLPVTSTGWCVDADGFTGAASSAAGGVCVVN